MQMETIPGSLNLRAVAPYRAGSGQLRSGRLWRSGAFDDIGTEGLERMRGLGLTRAFDLRSTGEKDRHPSPLLGQSDFTVISQAHDIRSGDLTAVLAAPGSTPEDCAAVMRAIYGRLPHEFAPVFRRYFRVLLAEDRPVAVHCTAGKDRTGVAVALLLELLGVGRADIFEDYLKTNAVRALLRERLQSRSRGVDFGTVRADLLEPVIAAEESYLAAMFAALTENHGSARRYADEMLGLSGKDIKTLQIRLVR